MRNATGRKKLIFVCRRESITEQEEYSAFADEKLKNETELDLHDWFEVDPCITICAVTHVLQAYNEIHLVSRAFP